MKSSSQRAKITRQSRHRKKWWTSSRTQRVKVGNTITASQRFNDHPLRKNIQSCPHHFYMCSHCIGLQNTVKYQETKVIRRLLILKKTFWYLFFTIYILPDTCSVWFMCRYTVNHIFLHFGYFISLSASFYHSGSATCDPDSSVKEGGFWIKWTCVVYM